MAGQLIQVATNTVTSPVASVTLTGINSDDVYMLAISNMTVSADTSMKMRLTYSSGTPDTSLNYDRATKQLRADTTFENIYGTNQDHFFLGTTSTSALQESFQGIYYLFNFNNASEYSFVTVEDATRNTSGLLRGQQGGFVVTQTRANDGIQILTDTANNIETGTFTLYKVV